MGTSPISGVDSYASEIYIPVLELTRNKLIKVRDKPVKLNISSTCWNIKLLTTPKEIRIWSTGNVMEIKGSGLSISFPGVETEKKEIPMTLDHLSSSFYISCYYFKYTDWVEFVQEHRVGINLYFKLRWERVADDPLCIAVQNLLQCTTTNSTPLSLPVANAIL